MEDVDAYLASVAEPNRAELERIRKLVRQLVPDAEESIAYAMPSFKYKGKPLIYYNAFKDHLSLFAMPGPTAAVQEQLAGYTVTKGTIKFTLDNPLSDEIIGSLLSTRMAEIEAK